jgi:hypothetical protein
LSDLSCAIDIVEMGKDFFAPHISGINEEAKRPLLTLKNFLRRIANPIYKFFVAKTLILSGVTRGLHLYAAENKLIKTGECPWAVLDSLNL